MTRADATRSPAGTESAWAYPHVPHGVDSTWAEVERVEAAITRVAPDARRTVWDRVLRGS